MSELNEAAAAPEGAAPKGAGRVFLVVVDETPELKVALLYACRRAQKTGGRVALLHVAETGAFQQHILGVGKLEKRVVVREVDGEDALLILPMAYVTLTIDHRVVDGHQTNAWLSRFVEIIESWE